ncbi:MAG: lysophospholipase [Proteobacteria bacterium]|nr:lysophospholipase [Pseudomonadota bacterium]
MNKFYLAASDGCEVTCYEWLIDAPRGVVHIAHGMGEHAQRYVSVAQALNDAGFSVYANDHRGHGETGAGSLGYMGADGWNRLLADAYEINSLIRTRHSGVPVVLLGHSMGSMMAQQYITRYGASIDALVLSGSPGIKAKSFNPIPRWILAFENRRIGPDGSSNLLQKSLFGGANKPFDQPGATGFEWLSRDPVEVQKYVDDELCGFVISTQSLVDLYAGSAAAADANGLAKVPKQLPVYVMSGTEDPVHSEQVDLKRLLERYHEAGLTKIQVRWYEGGRHEMFNETNRDEVTADLVGWLDKTLAGIIHERA